jgi:hypothetical protein
LERRFTDRFVKCSVCDCKIDQNNGDIIGDIGILPVAFCVWCYTGIRDMIEQCEGYNDINTLKEKINILQEEKL